MVALWGCGSSSSDGSSDTKVADTSQATDTSVATTTPDTTVEDAADVADTQLAGDSATIDSDTQPPDTTVTETVTSDTVTDDTTQATSCDGPDDCTVCAYGSAPATVADCYCVICPDVVMTKSQCDANAAAWDTVCGGAAWHDTAECPIPRCIQPTPPECDNHQCVAGSDKSACAVDDDCQRCAYDKPVTSAADCYCTFCGAPLDKATCAANQAGYQQFCEPWPKPDEPCPQASCIFPGPPICNDDNVCADHPDGCAFDSQCTTCAFSQIPKTPEDCRCPLCPQAHSQQFCDDVTAANETVCADFDFDSCPLPPCAFPGEPVCGADQRCATERDVEPR